MKSTYPFSPNRLYLVICSLLFLPPGLAGQTSQPGISDILNTYRLDSLFLQNESLENWAEQQSFRGSGFRQVEFRTETDRFDWERQEFTLRLSPRNIGENRLRMSSQENNLRAIQIRRSDRQAVLLRERYQAVSDYYFNEQRRAITGDQILLLREKIRLSALSLSDNAADPVDLAKTETDLFKAEISLDQLTSDQEKGISGFLRWLNITVEQSPEFDKLISVEGISKVLVKHSGFNPHRIPEIQYAEVELEDERIDQQLDRIQNRRWLDFVQARVRGDNNGFNQPEFSLGLGLNLPLLRENRRDDAINELSRKIAGSQLEHQIFEYRQKEAKARENLNSLVNRWEEFNERITNGITRKTLNRLSSESSPRPLELLLLREQLLIQELLLLDLEQKVYNAYINWLEAGGFLAETNPRNFFSVNLDVLRP